MGLQVFGNFQGNITFLDARGNIIHVAVPVISYPLVYSSLNKIRMIQNCNFRFNDMSKT